MRSGGRTELTVDPSQLRWILSARESTDREEQVVNQLTDLRKFVKDIGGTIFREVPENAVSATKKTRKLLPDGTYGWEVKRPKWDAILTDLRRGEANALAVTDGDRAFRDPRMLEDLVDVVEYYGVHVASMTGNMDLTTDVGISAARRLVDQRNTESRNTSRRVTDGKRHAAWKGGKHGGTRPFGWRKDQIRLRKREAKILQEELPRIKAGVTALTLAKEWNAKQILTATGKQWRASTVAAMYLAPRMCGRVKYRGAVLRNEDGSYVRGEWQPMMSDEDYDEIVRLWRPETATDKDADDDTGDDGQPATAVRRPATRSRLRAKGRGYRTIYLLSPFIRCGKCQARVIGSTRRRADGSLVAIYRCPSSGQGGCGGVSRKAEDIDMFVKAAVIADHRRNAMRRVQDLPPWPRTAELKALQGRIKEATRRYEAGEYRDASRYFSSLDRMEIDEAELKAELRAYSREQDARRSIVADLEARWDTPEFTMEEKQAAVAKSLTAVILLPANKGVAFHPDQIQLIWHQTDGGS
ncbi:recombinase family protein [Fodinicola feengrottensis]|uniref:Recombinase family protein n=2 Tax=Fodinicola feengrottensis TaxID=435914 RepID=A0ABN2J9L3_9ACTN